MLYPLSYEGVLSIGAGQAAYVTLRASSGLHAVRD